MKAVLTSTHNLCFELKYEKYQNLLSENFHLFLVVKLLIYLNRRVFVIMLLQSITNSKLHKDLGDVEMNNMYMSTWQNKILY